MFSVITQPVYQEVIVSESIEIIAKKDIVCKDALSYDIYEVWQELQKRKKFGKR